MGLSVTVAAGFVALLLLAGIAVVAAANRVREPSNQFAAPRRRPTSQHVRRTTRTDDRSLSTSPWMYGGLDSGGSNADCAPDAGSSSGADCGSGGDGGGGGGGD